MSEEPLSGSAPDAQPSQRSPLRRFGVMRSPDGDFASLSEEQRRESEEEAKRRIEEYRRKHSDAD
jgi:hypothetical protein